jgi:hypothetical protein
MANPLLQFVDGVHTKAAKGGKISTPKWIAAMRRSNRAGKMRWDSLITSNEYA